jgi:hypothetical protein
MKGQSTMAYKHCFYPKVRRLVCEVRQVKTPVDQFDYCADAAGLFQYLILTLGFDLTVKRSL